MQGRLSSGPTLEFRPGASSTISQSPTAYTIQNLGSSSLAINESYQSHSSPVSVEVSSDATMEKRIECLNGSNLTGSSSMMSVDQALRRLEVQLSLDDDDSLQKYAPVDDQDGNEDILTLNDLCDSSYFGVSTIPNGLSQQQDSGSEFSSVDLLSNSNSL